MKMIFKNILFKTAQFGAQISDLEGLRERHPVLLGRLHSLRNGPAFLVAKNRCSLRSLLPLARDSNALGYEAV